MNGYNQGHFENGIWIPDCARCGACCMYLFSTWKKSNNPEDQEDYDQFDALHGVRRIGDVRYVYAPCRFLESGGCAIHDQEDRPDCCKRFGRGNYHHPLICEFFGGNMDEEYYPFDYRHALKGGKP